MADQASHSHKRKNKWRGSDVEKKKFRNDEGKHQDVLSAAPRELRILDYVKSHVSEIKHLNAAVEIDMRGKSKLQRLPRHLQRRAMGHDIKRMPRSVRKYAQIQYANQQGKKKKPSRYHRRRPKNLLQEYTRRQRQHCWLETHIWHAKRFQMVEKWGYKLPWKPTEKSERACYRATTKHCLLQDLSYMSCIEISGAESVILDGLSHVTSTNTGSTFSSEPSLSGTSEGQTVVYQYDKYPYRAIAPVTFMWRALDQLVTTATGQRQLWVWCHPGCFDEVWLEFKKCLHLSETRMGHAARGCSTGDENSHSKVESNSENTSTDDLKEEECQSFISDKFKTDCSAVNFDQKVTMKSLTGSILRYRLTGPQSGTVLFDAIQPANREPDNVTEESDVWWKHEGDAAQREVIEKFSKCKSPAELPPCCIVGLTVEDPRLARPDKRTKIVAKTDKRTKSVVKKKGDSSTTMPLCHEKITPDISSSPLWDTNIRNEVTASKIPDHDMNKMKSENLVPGTPLQLGDKGSRIPVMLIQRPGVTSSTSKNQVLGSGWDILLPKGWGMPFWLSLVFRGARCGGIQEGENTAFEVRELHFPTEFPDTRVGRSEMEQSERSAVAKFNRRPPGSRTNYTKYGVTSPFACPWKCLIKEWCKADGETPVRVKVEVPGDSEKEKYAQYETQVKVKLEVPDDSEKEKYAQVKVKLEVPDDGEKEKYAQHQGTSNTQLAAGSTKSDGTFFVIRDHRLLTCLQIFNERSMFEDNQEERNVQLYTLNELQTSYRQGLVPVGIAMVQRGAAGQFSTVCIPSEEDIQRLEEDRNYGGPLEPQHVDQVQIELKKMKKDFKQKKTNKKAKLDRGMKMSAERDDIKVRHGFRNVIGYLTNGGFSLGSGYGAGKGFVSAVGFRELVQSSGGPEKFNCLVLVRSTSSLQYRFANMTILV